MAWYLVKQRDNFISTFIFSVRSLSKSMTAEFLNAVIFQTTRYITSPS